MTKEQLTNKLNELQEKYDNINNLWMTTKSYKDAKEDGLDDLDFDVDVLIAMLETLQRCGRELKVFANSLAAIMAFSDNVDIDVDKHTAVFNVMIDDEEAFNDYMDGLVLLRENVRGE